MKKVKHRERVTCQSHKLIRGRTKVRHTLTGFDTSGKNASLGTAKGGLASENVHGTPTPCGVKQTKPVRCTLQTGSAGVLCRQEVIS